jgi:hypothetical protein
MIKLLELLIYPLEYASSARFILSILKISSFFLVIWVFATCNPFNLQ